MNVDDVLNDEPVKTAELFGNKRPDGETKPDMVQYGKCVVVYPKGAKALDIERGVDAVETMQYAHITHRSQFYVTKEGQQFWFIFGVEEKHRVVVHGRRLRDVFNRINDHCVRRIRSADRKFDTDESVPFIYKIEVIPLPKDWKGDNN